MPKRAEVNQWFREYENPKKAVVLAVRDAVLRGAVVVHHVNVARAPTLGDEGDAAVERAGLAREDLDDGVRDSVTDPPEARGRAAPAL